MLGGCSALNFLMMVYPGKPIIDAWETLGNEGWNFDTLSPYFRKFAKTHPPSLIARDACRMDGYHDLGISASESGPLAVSFGDGFGPNNTAWVDAFEALGLKTASDPRKGLAVGAFQQAATIDPVTKTRTSAASAYLTEEVRARPNLSILTDTIVSRINLDKPDDSTSQAIATGVEVCSNNGLKRTIRASIEVILAAGALQTPQILELSGIGDREILTNRGVPVIIENENVGCNLQDHPIVCESFEVADGIMSGDILRDPDLLKAIVSQYQSSQDGPLGQSIISSAFVPSTLPHPGPKLKDACADPDYCKVVDSSGVLTLEARSKFFETNNEIHANATGSQCSELDRRVIRNLLETTNEPTYQLMLFPTQVIIPETPHSVTDYITPTEPDNYITVMVYLNHPFSRGTSHIASANVGDKPVWDPRYNSEKVDMELLARGVQFVEKLVDTKPFSSILKPNGKRLQNHVHDLESARNVVRSRQISVFHLSGSASMRPQETGGVVDTRLKVYGIRNLRVVDASVFPLEPSGNIQSTVYAVAERAADIIKEDRLKAGKQVRLG
jgi:choline dehydrogenase-like flavoprotein